MAFKMFTAAERETAMAKHDAEQIAAEQKAKILVAARTVIIDALLPLVPKMSEQDSRFYAGLRLDREYYDRSGVLGGSLARLSANRVEGLAFIVKRYLTADVASDVTAHLQHVYGPSGPEQPSSAPSVDDGSVPLSRHLLGERWVWCATCNSKLYSEDIEPGGRAEDRCTPCPEPKKCREESARQLAHF
ncbi:hypothetical protein [Burkholderia cepacia]|uniref:hypothetical protein n=1 Tax=Burkholderia cepacia TaxID=292 RepID=UPI002AB76389|nr:hypothetical protein [Burkholderia cepacia]